MLKKIISTCFTLVLFFSLSLHQVNAETKPGYSATITPGKKFFELLPGQSAEYTISYTNNLEGVPPQAFEVRVHDFFYDETGSVQFIDPSQVSDLSKSMHTWVQTPGQVMVSGGQKIEIPIRVVVPSDAIPGDKFGVVLIRSKPPEGGGAVGVQGQLASLVVLKVKGDRPAEKSGEVKEIKIATRARARNTVNFEFLYENTSQEFYSLRTVVDIYDEEDSLTPIKNLKNITRVFPNVPVKVNLPLGDLGDDYGEGTYFAKIVMQEETTSDTPKVFAKYEESFEYFLPIGKDQVEDKSVQVVEKMVPVGPTMSDVVKEIVIYVGGFLIVLLILIRVLFFGQKKSSKKD